MDKLECKALLSFQHINPYKRFIDDIYAQATSKSDTDNFHAHMNY